MASRRRYARKAKAPAADARPARRTASGGARTLEVHRTHDEQPTVFQPGVRAGKAGTVGYAPRGRKAIRTAVRLTVTLIGYVLVYALIAAAAIWLALAVSPTQTVDAAGQSAQVGATLPDLSWRGPGELDLFGQAMPTRPQFAGPIRPRLELTRITIDAQVVAALKNDGSHQIELDLSRQLAAGWERYFITETLIAAGFALPMLAGVMGLTSLVGLARPAGLTGEHGLRRRRALAAIATGLAVVTAVNVGGIALTARSTPATLRSIKTLDDLVGTDPQPAAPPPAGPAHPGVQAVVIGDSTAAGDGLPQAPGADALTRACSRSPDAYANALAAVNAWQVLNLSCSSATIENGLLGVQVLGDGQIAPAQFGEATQATKAKVIIVSVGADDVEWSVMTRLCVSAAGCGDKVSAAYFGSLLDQFTRDFYQLLTDLVSLQARPAVVINEYYDPFGASLSCLSRYGLTTATAAELTARLGELNQVLAQGAQAFGFATATPDFAGHELCTADPWVQGPGDPAPLHPNASGQLAIALADEHALEE
jgi:hypothetical protein